MLWIKYVCIMPFFISILLFAEYRIYLILATVLLLGILDFVFVAKNLIIKHVKQSFQKQINNSNVVACRHKEETERIDQHVDSANREFYDAMSMLDFVRCELKQKNDEILALNRATEIITSTFDVNEIVEYVYKVFNKFSGCDRYLICFVEGINQNLVCKYEFGELILNEIGQVITGNEYIDQCLEEKKTITKNNCFIARRQGMGDITVMPLTVSGKFMGVIYMETSVVSSFVDLNLAFFENIAIYAAIAVKNAELFNGMLDQKFEIESLYRQTAAANDELNLYIGELDRTKEELKFKNSELTRYYNEMQTGYLQTVMALANSIEAKDAYTRGHCQRVMEIACEIAKNMGYNEEQIEDLRFAAILHDIGKIGISVSIINKVGKLTDEEFNGVKKHPLIAYNILKEVEFIKNGIDSVLQHHERYDGTGYPYGLRGNEICEYGRILCIADAFDAMTSDRPYRKAMNMEDALHEIEKCKDTQFDPLIADIFVKMSVQIINNSEQLVLT